jgi:hypothetical protein
MLESVEGSGIDDAAGDGSAEPGKPLDDERRVGNALVGSDEAKRARAFESEARVVRVQRGP